MIYRFCRKKNRYKIPVKFKLQLNLIRIWTKDKFMFGQRIRIFDFLRVKLYKWKVINFV